MTTRPRSVPPLWTILSVLTLLLVLSAEILHAIHNESLTWDEGDHIFAGYESWKTHDFGLNPEHPPLVKQLATLPLLPLHLTVPPLQHRFFKTESYLDGRELLFRNGPANGGHYSAESLIFRVRLPTLLFTLAAALLVFFAGREMFSLRAGLIALALFAFEPNLLAHGAFVTTDMAAACTIFATIYFFWRYAAHPSLPRLAVVGLCGGLALAAKHSTVLLAPMLLLLSVGELIRPWLAGPWMSHSAHIETSAPSRLAARVARELNPLSLPTRARRLFGALAAITFIAVAILWAFYGFRYNARPAPLTLSPSLTDYVAPLSGIEARGILFAAHFHLLPESWLYGLADVRVVANDTPSYLFGHVYLHGVWFYFPVLFFIKSTLAMLVLLALTLFAIARGWVGPYRDLWFLTAPPALYLIVAMTSQLNIGARHILLVWVFLCVLTAAGASALIDHDHRWTYVIAALLLFHAASSLRAAPNYIAYSNEAWGGPTHTWRYLTDSNTDWAQQLLATSTYLRDHHITHCYIAYFAAPFILPADYGIPCDRLPTFDSLSVDEILDVPATLNTPILVSAGDLNGYEFGSSVLNPYQPLVHVHPIAFIQDGIFVFNGPVTLPLASALAPTQRSAAALRHHDIATALREATVAEADAPGAVEPEIALGNAFAAAGNKTEARNAYNRATTTINTMEPTARTHWLEAIQKKQSALNATH